MKNLVWMLAAVVVVTALSGCTTEPPKPAGGSATSVRITSVGEPAASMALVCWRVEGSGNVPHTAVHFDTTPHPGTPKFGDYAGGASYPGNQSAQASAGYNLPGDFCTNIPFNGTSTVYFRAHVIDSRGGDGLISEESEVQARAAANAVVAVTFRGTLPAAAPPNSTVLACWNVTGTGRAPHTAIHTDNVTHATAASFAAYNGTAFYPNNQSAQAATGYAVPGNFCTNVVMPLNGTLFLRAHAMITAPGILSVEERRIVVGNATNQTAGIAGVPSFVGTVQTSGPANTNVTVCWQASGIGTVPHTALHYGPVSQATNTNATFASYPNAIYPGNETAQNASGYTLPGPWCGNVLLGALGTTTYVRAHVIDSTGAPGRLSLEEKAIAST